MKWGEKKNTVVDKNPEMPVPIFGRFNIKLLDQFKSFMVFIHTLLLPPPITQVIIYFELPAKSVEFFKLQT